MTGLNAAFKNKEFNRFYLGDEYPRLIDAERVTGMITASHNTQA